MAKSLNTTNEYPPGISNQEHDKLMNLKTELSQDEEIKSELNNNKKSHARENSISRRKSRMHPDETNLDNLNRMKINQCQLIQNRNSIKQVSSGKHQYDPHFLQQQQNLGNQQQQCYLPVNKLNYLKLNRLQQQYLNSCACNNNNCELCELGSKQTRAIQQLQRELEMARCELRSLRNCLLLSNSSKQLNCMTYDDTIPPVRYACSVPNTPKLQRNTDCYNLECQDCLADYYQPTSMQSVHNISSPCGLEYLLPNVNSCNCYFEECADQAYDLHLASKKAYEQKKLQDKKSGKSVFLLENPSSDEMPMPMPLKHKTVSTLTNVNLTKLKGTDLPLNNQTANEDHLIVNKSNEKDNKPINQESRLNKNKTRPSLAGMQTFTLDQPDELDDYTLNNLNDFKQVNKNVDKDNDYFENVASNVITNVKTQSNSIFNRSKTSKSLTRSLSRDQQFGSLNYSKSESYDENLLHQKNRNDLDEDGNKKQSQNSIKNYETTC